MTKALTTKELLSLTEKVLAIRNSRIDRTADFLQRNDTHERNGIWVLEANSHLQDFVFSVQPNSHWTLANLRGNSFDITCIQCEHSQRCLHVMPRVQCGLGLRPFRFEPRGLKLQEALAESLSSRSPRVRLPVPEAWTSWPTESALTLRAYLEKYRWVPLNPNKQNRVKVRRILNLVCSMTQQRLRCGFGVYFG